VVLATVNEVATTDLVTHEQEMIAAVAVVIVIMDHVIVIMMMIIDRVERRDRDILIDLVTHGKINNDLFLSNSFDSFIVKHAMRIHPMVFNSFYFLYKYYYLFFLKMIIANHPKNVHVYNFNPVQNQLKNFNHYLVHLHL
jgi:hypothetical protein